jgi:hypothetical protein
VADGWIPLTGSDTDGQEGWINPAIVASVVFWEDRANRRVATVELLNGCRHDLREAAAIDFLLQLGRGEKSIQPANRSVRAAG